MAVKLTLEMRKMTFTEIITIKPPAPFDFDLTAHIFSNGDNQIRSFVNGQFSQVLKINNDLFLIKLSSAGTVDQPKIALEIKSNQPITSKVIKQAEEMVNFIFNFDFDLCTFYNDIKNEPIMNKLSEKLFGLKNPTTPTVFESLVDSIIEQQISIKVAVAIEERLTKKLGDQTEIDGLLYFAFPTPPIIARISIDEIQQVGLSRRKAEYIQGAAQLIVEGKLDLENLKIQQTPEEIISKLDAIRGIGIWTAELTMLRGMQKLDAFPADDLGVRRVISKYYCKGKPIKAEEVREIAKSWGRWKGTSDFLSYHCRD